VKIKPKEVKSWLRSLDVENGTRYKYKTVMGTVFTFSQSEGLLPLGRLTTRSAMSPGFRRPLITKPSY